MTSLLGSLQIFWILTNCYYIIWIIIQIWTGRKDKLLSKNVEATGSKSTYVIIVGILAGIVIAFEIFYFVVIQISSNTLVHWIGVAIALSGMIIHVTAIYAFGKYFKTVIIIQVKHELISKGLCKYFRHPFLLCRYSSGNGFNA